MGMLCTLIYTSGEEDGALFEDGTLKGMYEEISKEADKQGLKITYAPKGWVDLSSHYADSYDAIGYGIINPVVQGYIAEHYEYTPVEAVLKYDEYCNEIVKTLLGQEKGDLVRVYLSNTWKGFVIFEHLCGSIVSFISGALSILCTEKRMLAGKG